MILHTLNKFADHSTALHSCIATIASADALLLLEDGVYALLSAESLKASLPVGVRLYVLGEDMDARGLSERNDPHFKRINYADFVELTLLCSKVINWN